MNVFLLRYASLPDSTLGVLSIDGRPMCYTLEDEIRLQKVYGETAIAEGTYEITLRTEGKFYERYKKFDHEGSLWIRNVPEFTEVLIHIGNYPKDTDGCILVGMEPTFEDKIIRSTDAYLLIYEEIYNALASGGEVWIEIKNEFP